MQKTSTRGVQEADVWAAADALIAQGLRPTIERVRQQIGRGSPNTVSPMLETWFATLGQRLGVAAGQGELLPSSVPDPVQRLAQQLWDAAQEATQAELQEQQEQMARREASMQAQKEAMDQALQVAQAQSQDLSRRLDEMQQQLQDRDERLEEMRDALAEAARQREALQQKHGEEMQSAALERQRMAEQYAGNERHMLNEVDRARQEMAAARKTATEQERKAATRLAELQGRYEKSEEEQLSLHSQLQTAQNAAALAQERAADLRSLLEAQQRLAAGGALPDAGAGLSLGRRGSLSAARRSMTRLKDRRG